VTVAASGTAAQPIVFRGSASGVVLDGADAAIAAGVAWSGPASGVYSHGPLGFSTGHVVADVGRLFRYEGLTDLQNLPAGPPGGFWLDGATLRVKFSDGSSPAGHAMHVARRENGFYVDGASHVRIENLEIRHYGAGDFGKGVYLRYAADCAVRGSSIHENGAAGVWVKGGARNLIEENVFADTSIPGWDWDWTKGSSAEANGVTFTNDVGRGNVVRRNVFSGTFNGIGPCGSEAPPEGVLTTETDVYENLFLDHNDDALEPEGWCANVRIWGNHVEGVHMAFAVAPAAPGPTWIVRNVAYDFGATRTSQVDGYLASAVKVNSGYPEPVGPLLLYQNTFLTTAPETAAMTLLNPGESTYMVARDNVFAATAEALYKVNPIDLDWDRDLLFRSTAGRLVYWQGTSYADLAAFRVGTGLELAGLSTAPLLVDPGAGDFTPLSASPLVDAGIEIPGINDRRATADPPDIGAVERSLLFADAFEEGSTRRWSSAAP
jgi:parallel beta-helix repeat protein